MVSKFSSRLKQNINKNAMIPAVISNDQESIVIWMPTVAVLRRMIFALSDKASWRKLFSWVLKRNCLA